MYIKSLSTILGLIGVSSRRTRPSYRHHSSIKDITRLTQFSLFSHISVNSRGWF